MTRLVYHRNGVKGEKLIPAHYCSPEELNAFPEPSADSLGLLDMYKASKTRHLYCVDWDRFGKEMEVWGTENDQINY